MPFNFSQSSPGRQHPLSWSSFLLYDHDSPLFTSSPAPDSICTCSSLTTPPLGWTAAAAKPCIILNWSYLHVSFPLYSIDGKQKPRLTYPKIIPNASFSLTHHSQTVPEVYSVFLLRSSQIYPQRSSHPNHCLSLHLDHSSSGCLCF